MKTKPDYKVVPLEKFDDDTWRCVDECRQLVGYQEGDDWECPYLIRGEPFREQFRERSNHVGGLTCYPCLAKEAHKWVSLGLPIPATAGLVGGISQR